MRVVNLTPYDLNFVTPEGNVTIQRSGRTARLSINHNCCNGINFSNIVIPINETTYGDIEGLPEPECETYYIVQQVVATHLPQR